MDHQQQHHQQRSEVDTMETSQPQQPQHCHGAAASTASSDHRKRPAKQRRNSKSHTNSNGTTSITTTPGPSSMMGAAPLAERLSSSLASIAAASAQRDRNNNSSNNNNASSSSDSSSNPALVTNGNYTTGTTASNTMSSNTGGSTTTNSHSGSGGDEEDAADIRSRISSSLGPLHASYLAAQQSNNNNNNSSYPMIHHHRHHHNHQHHHHNQNHTAATQTSSDASFGLGALAAASCIHNDRKRHHKTSLSSTLAASTAAAPNKNNPVARKKRPHHSSSSSSEAPPQDLKLPSLPKPDAEDEENYGSNSSNSGSGTEAGYEGSASSNDNRRCCGGSKDDSKDSTSSGSSEDIPDFSSGASESNDAYAFATSPSNSPSLSSSNGDDEDEEDDISEDDPEENNRHHHKTRQQRRETSKSRWPPHMKQAKPSLPFLKKTPPVSSTTATAAAAPSSLTIAAKPGLPDVSQFTKITRRPKTKTMPSAPSSGVVVAKAPASTSSAVANETMTKHSSSKTLTTTTAGLKQDQPHHQKPPILSLGSDLMAHVLTFLEPPEIQRVLTMPLSWEWHITFCGQQELWRVLCLLEPFKAQVTEEDFSSSSSSSSGEEDDDGSLSSFSDHQDTTEDKVWTGQRRRRRRLLRPRKPQKLGKYRLLYTSFVRCMRYLERMKQDALHGRPPSMIDYGGSSVVSPRDISNNRSLQQFLAGARDVVEMERARENEESMGVQNDDQDDEDNKGNNGNQEPAAGGGAEGVAAMPANRPILSTDDGSNSYSSGGDRKSQSRKRKKNHDQTRRKKPKFGRSMLTDRLLGPAASGQVNLDHITLPWSCALYSIVNWCQAFSRVEGIQIACFRVLPFLLEDEQQRITAQRAGLTDVVLRGMLLFPNSVKLHTAAFHTLVLLARPLGGREGMLFHSSMVNSTGIFRGGGPAANGDEVDGDSSGSSGSMFSGGAQSDGRNGISVMLDSMRRFELDANLQAMSCWSLVNIALAPVQKEVLVKLGGIEATTNAMLHHPRNAEVQFRALFALINLVIPSVNVENNTEGQENNDLDDVANGSYAQELDEMVTQIADLVVLAMKNFCSSEAILNRACLVLHNLSLTQAYHTTLLWTPNCYQMLEWCLANYRTDQVLQQSAAGTLHRLQVTLSNDENLRTRFADSIQTQQQLSLEAARREAMQIYEQQEQLRQREQRAVAAETGAE